MKFKMKVYYLKPSYYKLVTPGLGKVFNFDWIYFPEDPASLPSTSLIWSKNFSKIGAELAQSWRISFYAASYPSSSLLLSLFKLRLGRGGEFKNKWWQKGGIRKRGNVPEGRSSGAGKRDLGGNNVGTGFGSWLLYAPCREVDILIFCLYGTIV